MANCVSDGTSEDAGLEFGDQIYSIGGHSIDTADQVNKILIEYRPGDLLIVQGYRSATGEGFEMKITLSQRP
ncbi:MAG: PDZ domain-containing protein [Chloroflexi bacterium]|nr:PDZ domain-containing protein [Chloroflexota bacterium]